MSKIITFFSPKTAGASTICLNAALLHKQLKPLAKIGLLEFSLYHSQATVFPTDNMHRWSELQPFLNTKEWNGALLQRAKNDLGIDVFWSPTQQDFPKFDTNFATAWFTLLREQYDFLYLDVNQSVPQPWQDFYFTQSDSVVGVVTPDPVSLAAWEGWSQDFPQPSKLSWVLNQAAKSELKNLNTRFADTQMQGVLRQEPASFWAHTYQSFPAVLRRRSGFKKDLTLALKNLLSF